MTNTVYIKRRRLDCIALNAFEEERNKDIKWRNGICATVYESKCIDENYTKYLEAVRQGKRVYQQYISQYLQYKRTPPMEPNRNFEQSYD